MENTIRELLDEKYLINQIDLFIYSTYLKKEDVEPLLHVCKIEKADLENLLNKMQSKASSIDLNFFAEYVNFREKFRDEERALFKKIFQSLPDAE